MWYALCGMHRHTIQSEKIISHALLQKDYFLPQQIIVHAKPQLLHSLEEVVPILVREFENDPFF